MRRVMARDRAQSLDADAARAHDPKQMALSLARNLNRNRRRSWPVSGSWLTRSPDGWSRRVKGDRRCRRRGDEAFPTHHALPGAAKPCELSRRPRCRPPPIDATVVSDIRPLLAHLFGSPQVRVTAALESSADALVFGSAHKNLSRLCRTALAQRQRRLTLVAVRRCDISEHRSLCVGASSRIVFGSTQSLIHSIKSPRRPCTFIRACPITPVCPDMLITSVSIARVSGIIAHRDAKAVARSS